MTISESPIEVISNVQAFDILRTKLVGSGHCDRMAVDCAQLRACVWTLSNGVRPVHVMRILNLAVDTSPYACFGAEAEGLRSHLREVLDELGEAGDLAPLEGGWWLPAPLRCVPLGTRTGYRLLIGGLPTHHLGAELASRIEHHGAFRRTRGSHVQGALDLPEEPYDSWIGHPPADLKSWAEDVFSVEMQSYSEPQGGGRLRIYDPNRSDRNAPQHFRWRNQSRGMTGRFLACRELPFGLRQYFIADITDGVAKGMVVPDLGLGDIRRLLYALDLKSGNPVTVLRKTHAQQKRFVLRTELPTAERRIFAATGQLDHNEDSYYPRIWDFSEEHAGPARDCLLALGIQIFGE